MGSYSIIRFDSIRFSYLISQKVDGHGKISKKSVEPLIRAFCVAGHGFSPLGYETPILCISFLWSLFNVETPDNATKKKIESNFDMEKYRTFDSI